MIRETSIEAYHKIKEHGLLSQRRWEVYDVLFHHGPLTGRECFDRVGMLKKGFTTHTAARLTELRDMGVIKEIGTKVCSITGMNVILWDVTSKLPKKFEKPKEVTCPHCNGKGKVSTQQARLF